MNLTKITTRVAALSMLAVPALVFAQGLTTVTPPQGTAQANLVDAIIFLLNALLILAALGALIFLIIGGARYIGSQGDEDAAESAKNTILFSIIGLIIIGLAAAIVNFFVRAIQSA